MRILLAPTTPPAPSAVAVATPWTKGRSNYLGGRRASKRDTPAAGTVCAACGLCVLVAVLPHEMKRGSSSARAAQGNGFKKGAALKMQQDRQAKLNPFELKVTKSKFPILNRQVAGVSGRPAQSRARSFQLRKQTLLPEMRRRGRSGEFIDRRFGERNQTLSTDDKMLARFQRERARPSRKRGVFDLQAEKPQEDYSHTLKLTHRGRNIDDLEDLDSEPSTGGDDSADDGNLDGYLVGSGHFGGGAEDVKRSKSEIMQEVIAKSKMYKHERQRIKQENADLCQDLDADFASFMGVLEAHDARLSAATAPVPAPRHDRPAAVEPPAAVDDYSESLRAMAFDRRVRPSDRTKTPEEIQAETRERLQKRQEEKSFRMAGATIEEADDDGEGWSNSSGDDDEAGGNDRDDDNADDKKDLVAKRTAESDAEHSLKLVTDQVVGLLDALLEARSLEAANASYVELREICQTNSVIPVARVLRERLTTIMQSCERLFAQGSAPVMPSRDQLLLFHLVGRIFPTSDYHHIVVTPTQLLMALFVASGRITRRAHVLSVLFLVQTLLHYQREAARYLPDMFVLLFPLLCKAFNLAISPSQTGGQWCPLPQSRFMSRSVHQFLAGEEETMMGQGARCHPLERLGEVRPISLEDLLRAEEEEAFPSREAIAGFLLYTTREACTLYTATNDAAPELLSPLLDALAGHALCQPIVAPLRAAVDAKRRSRPALRCQTFRAMAIPQLMPDLDNSTNREERERTRIRKTYKREFKGAKRELKRDSAFLSRLKLDERLEADRKYQERMRQIVGSIANEASALARPKAKRSPK